MAGFAIAAAYGAQRQWARSKVAMCKEILAELTKSVRTGMRGDNARYVDELSWGASRAADRVDQSCLYQIVRKLKRQKGRRIDGLHELSVGKRAASSHDN